MIKIKIIVKKKKEVKMKNKMKKKTLGMILKIPAILLLVGGFIGGIYAYSTGIIANIATPITLAIIVVLYFAGEYLQIKQEAW